MPHRNLADFLEDLGRAGELASIDAEVDPCLEVAEVTRRVARQNGPALLFRNVKGHDIPLVTNLFGTESRILRALGADTIEEATARIDRALNGGGPDGWLERLRFGGKSGAAANFAANRVKSGACQQVVKLGSDIDLDELPLLKYGKQIYTPALYSATAISADPETHIQSLLLGDMQIAGRDTVHAAWTDLAEPSRLVGAYRKCGGKMPVAIVLGGDPVVQLASSVSITSAADALNLAGLLRDKPLDAVACRTNDLLVPAEADIVIEGFINPSTSEVFAESRLTPASTIVFGQSVRVLFVTAITHRADRVLPTGVRGLDCDESPSRDRLLSRLLLPHLRRCIPGLIDFDLPLSGFARHIAVLSIEKTYVGQARDIVALASGVRLFKHARLFMVVDADVDVRNIEQVLAVAVREVHWEEDAWHLELPPDPLDLTACQERVSRRLALDATSEFTECGDAPTDRLMRDECLEQLVTDRWAEYGLGPEAES